jgi:hypothetical protein
LLPSAAPSGATATINLVGVYIFEFGLLGLRKK